MLRFVVERSLRDVGRRLRKAREELAILDEQLQVFREAADDTRIRFLVSETPETAREALVAGRHVDAMAGAREALLATIRELEGRQDELLDELA
ncbi:MAG: hypothetical protein M1399_07680 [Actinobacteria bacterium]|nr:hypothetical protein [Actinomycetota bacterium]MCL5446029.1 hypothetical protein [Actinomycetota bacterium]